MTAAIPLADSGRRLDQVLGELFPEFSRARLQRWLKEGKITLDGRNQQPKYKVNGGEQVVLDAEAEAEGEWQAQAIPLEVVYEDESILVINKPAGLVVHPAAGNRDGTLLNALLHHAPELAQVPRAGIVHRLDKDTTGLLVVARTLAAQAELVRQLQARAFTREYDAVACGVMVAGGSVNEPIGRHPVDRKRMAVRGQGGKEAITHYRVERRFRAHTHVKVRLETGRTHQIRVHLAHIRYPLVGDAVYGGRLRLPSGAEEALVALLRGFHRQALHAALLGLHHPVSGEWLQWQAPLPDDMQQLLSALAEDQKHGAGEFR